MWGLDIYFKFVTTCVSWYLQKYALVDTNIDIFIS